MATLPLRIAHLPAHDLDQAAAVLDAAYGRTGMVAGLRLAYGLQPESWFFIGRNEQIIALVGAYDYGPVASIGMMAVAPSAQRQGVGEKLLVELVGYLDGRGCPLLFLDASAAGQRLYPKLGFVPEGETVRLKRVNPVRYALDEALQLRQASRGDQLIVIRLEEGDLVEVAAFDAPVFGADRGAVIRSFWSGSPDRAFVVRDAGDGIAGYLIAGGNHIGPWAAATRDAAAALLSAALALPFDDPPFLTCPADNGDALSLLEQHGFVVTERLLHMRRGGARDPRQTLYLFAQASLTLG